MSQEETNQRANEASQLTEHFYNSLEDPDSTSRGLVIISLFVVLILLPISLLSDLVFICVVVGVALALGLYLYARIFRWLRIRSALRLLSWLRSMPFAVEGYLDALNFEPLRDRFFYLRAELSDLETPISTKEFGDLLSALAPRIKTRIQVDKDGPSAVILTSSRLMTQQEDKPRSNINCHRWLNTCLKNVILPLHQKYPLQRVVVYHQNI